MKKAVVTGGAGFIGSHVGDLLVKEGYEVHVVDTLVAGKRENVNPVATLHEVDIRNYEELLPVFKDAVAVFHLAALPRIQFSIDSPAEAHDANVNGTVSVLRAAKDAGVGRVVFSSSSAVYGTQPVLPFVESMHPVPESPYALHKLVGEEYCRVFNHIYGLSTVSLRYFNIYGPRLDPEGPYALVIGRFMKLKNEGKPLTITGDGEQTRDFTHVRDIARANIAAAFSDKVGKGEVINVGAGKPVSVNELAKRIGGPVEYVPARVEVKHTFADASKAAALLSWKPEVNFDEGLAELLAK